MEGGGKGCPSPVFPQSRLKVPSPSAVEFAELSLLSIASLHRQGHDSPLPSPFPPVPQNLSPSLAVFGISPVTQTPPSPIRPGLSPEAGSLS